jgi:hypothetical protein
MTAQEFSAGIKQLSRQYTVLFCSVLLVGAMATASLVIGRRSARGIVVHLLRIEGSGDALVKAEFSVSNATSRLIGGFRDVPQVHSDGRWERLSGVYKQDVFYLKPGESTNLTVQTPQCRANLRVPFVWGREEGSIIQKLTPRLHTRFSNLRHTLRTSGTLDGWHDDQGYLSANTNFYIIESNR